MAPNELKRWYLLANEISPLLVQDATLKDCPNKTRRSAVEAVVQEPKAEITWACSTGRPIPNNPLTPFDYSHFSVTIKAEQGYILPQWRDPTDHSHGQGNPKFGLLYNTLRCHGICPEVEIRQAGQSARQRSISMCNPPRVVHNQTCHSLP